MQPKVYYVYVLTNERKTVLYTGVTNDLLQRITEHYKYRGQQHSFTSRYHVYYLLWFEPHKYINNAIARDKRMEAGKENGIDCPDESGAKIFKCRSFW